MPPTSPVYCEPEYETIRNNISEAANNWIKTVYNAAFMIQRTNFKIIFPTNYNTNLIADFEQEINRLLENQKTKARTSIYNEQVSFYAQYPFPCPKPKDSQPVLIEKFNKDYATALINISKHAQIAISVMLEYHRQTPQQSYFVPAFDPQQLVKLSGQYKKSLSWRHSFTISEVTFKEISLEICKNMTDVPIANDIKQMITQLHAARQMVINKIDRLPLDHKNRNGIISMLHGYLFEAGGPLSTELNGLTVCTGRETFVTHKSTATMYQYYKGAYAELKYKFAKIIDEMLVKFRAVRFTLFNFFLYVSLVANEFSSIMTTATYAVHSRVSSGSICARDKRVP